jgi:hypothetical protein
MRPQWNSLDYYSWRLILALRLGLDLVLTYTVVSQDQCVILYWRPAPQLIIIFIHPQARVSIHQLLVLVKVLCNTVLV